MTRRERLAAAEKEYEARLDAMGEDDPERPKLQRNLATLRRELSILPEEENPNG